jgi:hypothetical protein
MNLASRLSGLNRRFRLGNSAAAPRRARRKFQVPAQVPMLEPRCMLSRGDTPTSGLLMPATNVSDPNMVMSQKNVTLKTITFTNNTDHKLYPFLEDVNVGINPNTGQRYDYTSDPGNEEYRLYLGYQVKSTGVVVSYLGVLPHSTLTVNVPVVFWDGGTVRVVGSTAATSERFLQPFNPGGNALGRPFLFNAANASYSQQPATFLSRNGQNKNVQGMVLLYHTTDPQSKGVLPDAPSQLLEFTFRDPSVPNGNQPPFTKNVDYDISYINAAYLPVAMEATKLTNGKQSAGYVGTLIDTATFGAATRTFAAGTQLNNYFGGKGWPRYYLNTPPDPVTPTSLLSEPGGANVFANTAAASSYDLSHTMLTSAAGSGVVPPSGKNYAATTMVNLWFGWLNYYSQTTGTPITGNLLKLMTQPGVQPVTITPSSTLTWKLLSGQTVTDTQFATAFATTVYTVMKDFSNDPNLNFNSTGLTPITQFMSFILGNNVADIFGDTTPQGILLTQQLIALMRGEPNTSIPVQGQPSPSYALDPSDWYPTPASPQNAKFGAEGKYNLNPFVWFIHKDIGKVYAYAFSVDDEYGNVQVDNSSQIQIAVGGSTGIALTKPFVNGE